MITHGNLMHQLDVSGQALGFGPDTISASRVPQYHDLGLVGGLFNALYNGSTYATISPATFLPTPPAGASSSTAPAPPPLRRPTSRAPSRGDLGAGAGRGGGMASWRCSRWVVPGEAELELGEPIPPYPPTPEGRDALETQVRAAIVGMLPPEARPG